MSDLVGSHDPIGTPEEASALGLDLSSYATCAPGNTSSMRGCAFSGNCIFKRPEYGGFYAKGPRYVGYNLRTAEGRRKEDFTSCFHFMRTLYDRMREQDRTGEFIEVVAQEGEFITTIKRLAGPPSSPGGTGKLVETIESVKVPQFPRPADVMKEELYEQALVERRRERARDQRLSMEGLRADVEVEATEGEVATGKRKGPRTA